jgi:hypothetical protein
MGAAWERNDMCELALEGHVVIHILNINIYIHVYIYGCVCLSSKLYFSVTKCVRHSEMLCLVFSSHWRPT